MAVDIKRPDVCGESERSATMNVGPVLMGTGGALFVYTTEHIPQHQPSQHISNFVGTDKLASSEADTLPPTTFLSQ